MVLIVFRLLLTETVQLVTHLGWFNLDNLLNDTIGCILALYFIGRFEREGSGTNRGSCTLISVLGKYYTYCKFRE